MIDINDDAYCWGNNNFGYLGNGTTNDSSIPVAVSKTGALTGKKFKSITVAGSHSCAIASDDNAYCWGYNPSGELGNNSTTSSSVPVAVSTSGVLAGKTIKKISTGIMNTCVIASDDKGYCWGQGAFGVLGNNTNTDSSVPVAVSTSGVLAGKSLQEISVGDQHVCAVATSGQAYCWGLNSGRLGDNNPGNLNSLVPVAVTTSGVLSGKTVKSISVGGGHTCAIASDDQLYCWGLNSNGQLGNSLTTTSPVPVAVTTSGVLSGKTIKLVSLGSVGSCAIASDNLAYCWGNNSGKFGDGTLTSSSVPVIAARGGALAGMTLKKISVNFAVYAIASNNKAYCWGENNAGQLGNGTTTKSLIPTAVFTP